jgi:hypothetical protein
MLSTFCFVSDLKSMAIDDSTSLTQHSRIMMHEFVIHLDPLRVLWSHFYEKYAACQEHCTPFDPVEFNHLNSSQRRDIFTCFEQFWFTFAEVLLCWPSWIIFHSLSLNTRRYLVWYREPALVPFSSRIYTPSFPQGLRLDGILNIIDESARSLVYPWLLLFVAVLSSGRHRSC